MQSIIFRKGDTLSAIAKANNTTVDALMKANNLLNASLIKIGQAIKVPDKYEASSTSLLSKLFPSAQPASDTVQAFGAPASTPTLKKGASGSAVSEMQQLLKNAGFNPGAVDGQFGPNTEAALKAFQKAKGLEVDGSCGPKTWAALRGTGSSAAPASTAPASTANNPTLRKGASGAAVSQMQQLLKNAGFNPGAIDGQFGPNTEAALKSFQKAKGLVVDGICGPKTWAALGNSSGTPVTPSPGGGKIPQVDGKSTATGTLGTAYNDFLSKIRAGVTIDSKYSGEIDRVMGTIGSRMSYIDEIAKKADLPRELVAAIWYRENSAMATDVYLHNGQKLGKTTTLVPTGVFFRKDQFVEAAVDALKRKAGNAKALGLHYGSKDFAAMAAYTEAYNGFGYRNKGRASAYVLAGTQYYKGGMYVADGTYNSSKWDSRPGTLALMTEMAKRFPS